MASTEDDDSNSGEDSGEVIGDGDLVARQIFYETSFEGSFVSVNKLLQFQGNRNDDGSFDESLFLLRLTTPPEIHDAGCSSAKSQNERVRAKREGKGLPGEPVSGEDRRYYCGFTRASAAELKISGANYNIQLTLTPEGGMISHVAIFLRPAPQKKINANDRTEAGVKLARFFTDPNPHVCDVDAADVHHPVTKHGPGVLTVTAA